MELVWRRRAYNQFEGILDYVLSEFGGFVMAKTYQKIINGVISLLVFPRSCERDERIKRFEVRRKIINPASVYYLIEGEKIYILAVIDNRMSPDRIDKMLKDELDSHSRSYGRW